MSFTKTQKLVLAALILLLPTVLALTLYFKLQSQAKRSITAEERLTPMPKIILWAWERPEDLRFINPTQTGVAVLAMTMRLSGGETTLRPRLQPLQIPQGTYLIAVTRLETDKQHAPEFSLAQRHKIIAGILQALGNPRVAAVQIDFDATTSERNFYQALLTDLRQQLPDTMPLSITALASWGLDDNWITDLAADEAVPMLFRLGVDEKQIINRLTAGGDFRPPIARRSFGISTDQPLPRLPSGRRVYIFSERPWSAEAAHQAIQGVQQWQ
ncbi:MAG: DUF3142 domain-containing protein [Acidobacteria bacterium]|nr:DUF3142 domain-containing protein [Acidobacteriota bacterium]